MNARQVSAKTYNVIDGFAEHALTRLLARLAGPLALAFIAWLATEVGDLGKQQARAGAQLDGLQRQVEMATSEIYTQSEASRDWTVQDSRDDRQDTDRSRIETRIAEFETWLRGIR